ncbi:MAG: glutathione S-transferase [Alphaproteobacteria bacterium]|nr:glutathione S-transferase [Alphaproteobacteria bacterium]
MTNAYTLLIGSRNLSSWSLRGWLALKLTGVPFETKLFSFHNAERAQIATESPSGMVPSLSIARPGQAPFWVWDSLAIGEFLAETHPSAHLWPADSFARARARSVSAEMHSGFADLRRTCPMNIVKRVENHSLSDETKRNVGRIQQLWRECRHDFGQSGDFLFGALSLADCFYAPVVTRFITYGVAMDETAAAYADAITSWAAMKEWTEGATQEEATRKQGSN